jgi:hypothetical protein
LVVRDLIREYYESKWGLPHREARFELSGNEIEVYKWGESVTGEGVTIYATNGASAKESHSPKFRVEFFIGFRPEFDDIASALSLLGSYPLAGGSVVDGDTVTLGDPLWSASPARTFLIAPQIEELLPPLLLPNSSHVHFCQAIPISDAELDLKKRHGAEWLLGELNDRGMVTSRHDRRYL